MARRILLGLCALAASTTVLVTSAGAAIPPQGNVRPNQVFAAAVNGQSATATSAIIRMACVGPIRPGQMGHPVAGQTVEVFRPEAIVANEGFTGPTARSIMVFFGPPPPLPAATPVTSPVVFRHYGVAKAIPTSVLLPCAGPGVVSFVPLPSSPLGSARAAVVPVSYIGQP